MRLSVMYLKNKSSTMLFMFLYRKKSNVLLIMVCIFCSQWGLLCQEYVTSLITSVQMVGVLIGACITGQLADTFGRRRILYAVYTLMLISVFLSAFSNSWQLYMVMRFFVGLFFGGMFIIPYYIY